MLFGFSIMFFISACVGVKVGDGETVGVSVGVFVEAGINTTGA